MKIIFRDLNLTFWPAELIARLSSNVVPSLRETRPRWNGTYRAKGKDRTYLRGGTRWKAFYRLTYIVNCLKRRPGALRTNLNSESSRYIDTCKLGKKTPDHYSIKKKKMNKLSQFSFFFFFNYPIRNIANLNAKLEGIRLTKKN